MHIYIQYLQAYAFTFKLLCIQLYMCNNSDGKTVIIIIVFR